MAVIMKIVMISDVHNLWDKIVIPECDLLISAGDYSSRGHRDVVEGFHTWMSRTPAKYKISVQGNHELWVEKNFNEAKDLVYSIDPSIHFIQEGRVEIEDKVIWGSAITPTFFNWAWNRNRGEQIRKHWDLIPDDTNILITHGQPYGILDVIKGDNVGCEELLAKVNKLDNLELHVFGHIHYSSGERKIGNTHYVNASICGENYKVKNPIRVIEL